MKSFTFVISTVLLLAVLVSCRGSAQPTATNQSPQSSPTAEQHNSAKVIHVVVALCDNQYQGIVPVPALIGNGDDPARNLYWGAAYGVKTFFKHSDNWSVIADIQNPKDKILERLIFKHKTKNAYLIADAYRGREIKQSTIDFLNFAAGRGVESIKTGTATDSPALYAGGGADLLAYVGHDGLMDFNLFDYPTKSNDTVRSTIILACISKRFFLEPIRRTGAKPLLWTTGLMAPESYILKAAVDSWLLNEDDQQVRKRAAVAYNQYQKCGIKAATNLFATGW